MFARQIGVRAVHALALAGVVASVGGCAAKVKREDYNNDMARLREEIATSDRQVGTRVDSTNKALADQNKTLADQSKTLADQTRRLDALEQDLQAFRSEYKVSIEKLNGMLKFDMPVHFDFARADVREADRPVLDRFASVVKQYYPGALITVEGFADPAGSASYNKKLGQKRADAVKGYLATAGGFEAANLKAVSYGEAKDRQVVAGAKGPGDEGMENRRVALVVDHLAIATDRVPDNKRQ